MLPSSLTRVLPDRLGMLYPSTCVGLRYGHLDLARRFSQDRLSQLAFAFHSLLGVDEKTDLLSSPPTGPDAHSQSALNLLRSRSRPCSQDRFSPAASTACAASSSPASTDQAPCGANDLGGIGISADCPSPTAFALGLGPTNPERINLPRGNLRHTACVSHVHFATHADIRTSARSSPSSVDLPARARRSLPRCTLPEGVPPIKASVPGLSRWIFGAESLTSEGFVTHSLNGGIATGQHPGCLSDSTSFPT